MSAGRISVTDQGARVYIQNTLQRETRTHDLRPLHVLVCPDQPDWAFDNIARNIARYAGVNRVSKLYMRDVIGNEQRLFETIFLQRIDLCHIFWREDLFYLLNPVTLSNTALRMGFDDDMMAKAVNGCAFTTSVYDHLFTGPDEIRERRQGFALADGYTVSSAKLHDIYSAQPDIPPPDGIIADGVDTDQFCPLRATWETDDPLTIGWVGNSAWGRMSSGPDVKGFSRVFEPMMAELRKRGYRVEAKVADPQIKRIDFEDMPGFYRQLDLFVCTSAIEGTPNPLLEAMACGIPVVSTDVGIVPEVFGERQKRFIVPQADPGRFADAVGELINDAGLRRALGEENRQMTLDWSWEKQTRHWWPFWHDVVRRTMDPRNATRREICLRALAHVS